MDIHPSEVYEKTVDNYFLKVNLLSDHRHDKIQKIFRFFVLVSNFSSSFLLVFLSYQKKH